MMMTDRLIWAPDDIDVLEHDFLDFHFKIFSSKPTMMAIHGYAIGPPSAQVVDDSFSPHDTSYQDFLDYLNEYHDPPRSRLELDGHHEHLYNLLLDSGAALEAPLPEPVIQTLSDMKQRALVHLYPTENQWMYSYMEGDEPLDQLARKHFWPLNRVVEYHRHMLEIYLRGHTLVLVRVSPFFPLFF